MLIVIGAVTGCQTNEQYQAQVDASLDARLDAYNGATMAEFTARTGLTPNDAYPVAGARVFVFDMAPVVLTLPPTHVTPAVSRSFSCRLMLRAVQVDAAGTADSWRIVGSQRSGPCNNLPV